MPSLACAPPGLSYGAGGNTGSTRTGFFSSSSGEDCCNQCYYERIDCVSAIFSPGTCFIFFSQSEVNPSNATPMCPAGRRTDSRVAFKQRDFEGFIVGPCAGDLQVNS